MRIQHFSCCNAIRRLLVIFELVIGEGKVICSVEVEMRTCSFRDASPGQATKRQRRNSIPDGAKSTSIWVYFTGSTAGVTLTDRARESISQWSGHLSQWACGARHGPDRGARTPQTLSSTYSAEIYMYLSDPSVSSARLSRCFDVLPWISISFSADSRLKRVKGHARGHASQQQEEFIMEATNFRSSSASSASTYI